MVRKAKQPNGSLNKLEQAAGVRFPSHTNSSWRTPQRLNTSYVQTNQDETTQYGLRNCRDHLDQKQGYTEGKGPLFCARTAFGAFACALATPATTIIIVVMVHYLAGFPRSGLAGADNLQSVLLICRHRIDKCD